MTILKIVTISAAAAKHCYRDSRPSSDVADKAFAIYTVTGQDLQCIVSRRRLPLPGRSQESRRTTSAEESGLMACVSIYRTSAILLSYAVLLSCYTPNNEFRALPIKTIFSS